MSTVSSCLDVADAAQLPCPLLTCPLSLPVSMLLMLLSFPALSWHVHCLFLSRCCWCCSAFLLSPGMSTVSSCLDVADAAQLPCTLLTCPLSLPVSMLLMLLSFPALSWHVHCLFLSRCCWCCSAFLLSPGMSTVSSCLDVADAAQLSCSPLACPLSLPGSMLLMLLSFPALPWHVHCLFLSRCCWCCSAFLLSPDMSTVSSCLDVADAAQLSCSPLTCPLSLPVSMLLMLLSFPALPWHVHCLFLSRCCWCCSAFLLSPGMSTVSSCLDVADAAQLSCSPLACPLSLPVSMLLMLLSFPALPWHVHCLFLSRCCLCCSAFLLSPGMSTVSSCLDVADAAQLSCSPLTCPLSLPVSMLLMLLSFPALPWHVHCLFLSRCCWCCSAFLLSPDMSTVSSCLDVADAAQLSCSPLTCPLSLPVSMLLMLLSFPSLSWHVHCLFLSRCCWCCSASLHSPDMSTVSSCLDVADAAQLPCTLLTCPLSLPVSMLLMLLSFPALPWHVHCLFLSRCCWCCSAFLLSPGMSTVSSWLDVAYAAQLSCSPLACPLSLPVSMLLMLLSFPALPWHVHCLFLSRCCWCCSAFLLSPGMSTVSSCLDVADAAQLSCSPLACPLSLPVSMLLMLLSFPALPWHVHCLFLSRRCWCCSASLLSPDMSTLSFLSLFNANLDGAFVLLSAFALTCLGSLVISLSCFSCYWLFCTWTSSFSARMWTSCCWCGKGVEKQRKTKQQKWSKYRICRSISCSCSSEGCNVYSECVDLAGI